MPEKVIIETSDFNDVSATNPLPVSLSGSSATLPVQEMLPPSHVEGTVLFTPAAGTTVLHSGSANGTIMDVEHYRLFLFRAIVTGPQVTCKIVVDESNLDANAGAEPLSSGFEFTLPADKTVWFTLPLAICAKYMWARFSNADPEIDANVKLYCRMAEG